LRLLLAAPRVFFQTQAHAAEEEQGGVAPPPAEDTPTALRAVRALAHAHAHCVTD
jgi:hypothetical protein